MTSYFCNDIIAQLNQRCNGCFWCYPAILYFTHQTYANTKMHERVSHSFKTDQELEQSYLIGDEESEWTS